ncbi:MAG: hypothetical protein ACFFC6_07825 [Promethearchaeota archaeon]
MKKLKIIFITLSLLLIGGSTAFMIASLQSQSFFSIHNVITKTIPPLKGNSDLGIMNPSPEIPIIPSFSIQDFPEPTVEVFYFTDHVMDLRGYGNDTVRFNMKFRSTTERAWYYGYAQLWTSDHSTAISLEAYWSAWVDPNINTTASFDISGYEIRLSGIDGPYSVRLRFYKENETTTTIYNSAFVHTTPSYLSSEFQARPNIDITMGTIDRDSNGIEWINIYVTCGITIPDYYYFSGEIEGGGVTENARNNTYLSVGSHTVLLKFAAWDFQRMSGSDTISITDLYVRHDTSPSYQIYSGQPANIIGPYAPTDFDTPPLELTGRYWGEGVDTDDNSKFNYYRFIFEVKKLRIEEGDFYFYPSLYKPPNVHIHGTSTNWVALDSTGLVNVTVDFNGIEVYKSGIVGDNFIVSDLNGNFYHRSDIGYNWEDYFFFSDSFTTSDTYTFSEFEGPGAYLTDNFYDSGLDTDIPADGLFNYLILKVEVDVDVAGDYTVGGWLELPSSGTYIAYASTTVNLPEGIHNVTLQYNGDEFFLKAVNEVIQIEEIYLNGGSPYTRLDSNSSTLLSHYLFTNFNPPKARFTGIYSDSVADNNGDGLWDELRISVEVEMNRSGIFKLRGAIKNLITDQRQEVFDIKEVLVAGTVSFVLTFPSEWIWSQHTTTTYLLDYVYINEVDVNYNNIRQWDYRDTPFTTDTPYNSDEFNPPPVYFTGVIIDSGDDVDSDGKSDFLLIEVEINVTQTLPYNIRVMGYLYIEGTAHSSSSYLYDPGVGTHLVYLRWHTIKMYQTSTDQRYTVNFYLDRTDNWVRLDGYLDYETSHYAYTQFDPPSAELTGNFADMGIDSDDNGRINYLELAFEVDVAEEGYYRVYGQVYADEGGESFTFSTSGGTKYLSTGLQSLTVEIDYYWFLGHSSGCSLYVGYIYLYRNIATYGDLQMDYDGEDHYLSRTYNHNEFEIPPITLSDNVSYDFGVDTDASGTFDYLELVIEVNITEAGAFSFNGYVYSDSGGVGYHFNSGYLSFEVGLHNVSFEIDIAWIRSHDDGSAFYIGEIYLYEYISAEGRDYQRGYLTTDHYFSRIYYHNEFDPPDAFVSRIPEYYPVDFNKDGKYDVYRIVFEVNVTVPSFDLYIYSELNEQDTNIFITATYIDVYDLTVGLHNISIDFRGDEIYSSGFTNGLKLSHYHLKGIGESKTADEFHGTFLLTVMYTFVDFNPEYFPLIRVIDITVIENSFDQVEINATILRYSSEVVDMVTITTEYEEDYPIIRIFMGDNYEIWTYTYTPSTIDTYHFVVHAYGNWGSKDSMIYQTGGPAFIHLIGFQVNATYGFLGDVFLFSARVNDSDGISDVTLDIEGTEYPMSLINIEPEFELWEVTVQIDQAGYVTAFAKATDLMGITSYSYEITMNIDAGQPEIRSFTMNTTFPITVGGAIYFEALVRDPDGIQEVTLVTQGTEYSMDFIDTLGDSELWGVAVTFHQAGDLIAFIIVKDGDGITAQSEDLDIIVNEGSVIESVEIDPGTRVKVDEEIFFQVEIQKSDAIITSVTLEILDDRGNEDLVPLEMIRETTTLEVYEGSYTPTRSGTYECTIRVLNTKNQQSKYRVTIVVRGDQEITGVPGFELFVALGILIILPLARKRWNNER